MHWKSFEIDCSSCSVEQLLGLLEGPAAAPANQGPVFEASFELLEKPADDVSHDEVVGSPKS